MDFNEACSILNINKSEVLNRFAGMEKMVIKFWQKIPNDATYSRICEAVEKKDWKEIESQAHTLKGVSANLGFQTLYEKCAALVQAMRDGNTDDTDSLFAELTTEYQKVVDCVNKLG